MSSAAVRDGGRSWQQTTGAFRWAVGTATFLASILLIISRRPDAVLHPQFWAEDGSYWFADAYNLGLTSVTHSLQGYLDVMPRLLAMPIANLSFTAGALGFNVVAIAIQAAPALFVVSRRFQHIIPRLWVRSVLALAYLLLPSAEINATITNAQWHLALLAVLVLLANPTARRVWRCFDVVVLFFCALTGPFAVLLLPVALVQILRNADARTWYASMSGMLAAALAVQGWAILHSHRDTLAHLGISLRNLAFIVGDRVVLAGTFAEEGHAHVFTEGKPHGAVVAALITLFGAGIAGFALLRGPASLKIFVLYCGAITALGTLSPLLGKGNASAWDVLANSDNAQRYFISAELAWLICLAWSVGQLPRRAMRAAVGLLLVTAFGSGLINAWSYPPFSDLHPDAYYAQLQAATSGTRVIVPINPPSWFMTLSKH